MNPSSSRKFDYESVDSLEQLNAIHDDLIAKYPEHIVLYRGQTRLYPRIQSGRHRLGTEVNADVEQGWSVVAGRIIAEDGQAQEQLHLRKAVLQHYGFVTDYLDLTSDIQIAAWFATNEFESHTTFWAGGPPRRFMQTRYSRRTDGTGYVIAIAVKQEKLQKESPTLFNISDLRHLVRPQRQKAWLMLDRPPFLPDPNSCWVATIEINCQNVAPPFVTNDLFPTTDDDPGYRALLSFPFIQAQTPLLASDPTKGSAEALTFLMENRIPYFAVRAIDAPEYVNQYGHGYYDHKWQDTTVFEPTPMQNWFTWNFPLQDHYPEMQGNIGAATKISISPEAADVLAQEDHELRLSWPRLGSDDLLFTFSQYSYDRVDDLEWPFSGVWLHRSRNLILEHPVTSDHEKLNVHAGHAYEFSTGQLIRRDIEHSCPCDRPENHDARVRSMLGLTSRLEREELILIPHPMALTNCYVVL
jgi:hypothetical protein